MCMIKHHSLSDGDLVDIVLKNHRKSAQSIFWHMTMISVLFSSYMTKDQSAFQIFKVNIINVMLNSYVKTSNSLRKDPQSTTDQICRYPAQGRGWDGITDLYLPPEHLLAPTVMQQMFTHSHEWMDSILKVKEQGYITSALNWRYKQSLQIFTSLEEFRCLLLLVQVRRRIECEIKRRSGSRSTFPPSPVVMNFEKKQEASQQAEGALPER